MAVLKNGGFLYIEKAHNSIFVGTLSRLDMFGIKSVVAYKHDVYIMEE